MAAPATPTPVGEKRWHAGTLTYTTASLSVLFFWLLWGDFAWQLKERSVPYVIQLLFKKFEVSDTVAGLLIGSLPQVLGLIVGPIIAYKSDRHRGPWGRRIPFLILPTPVIVLAILGLAYSPVMGGSLHRLLGVNSPGLNATILILLGTFWTLFEFATTIANSVFYALINDVVPQQVIGRFFGMFRALSLLAGVGFNYWLLGKAEAHYVSIFIGLAMLYGIGFAMMGLKVKEGEYPSPPQEQNRRVANAFSVGQRYFQESFGNPYYRWFYASMALSWMALIPVNLFSLFFAQSIRMEMSTLGQCYALTFAISFVLSYPLGVLADRFHPLRLGLIMQGLYILTTLWGGFFARDVLSFSVALIGTGVLSGAWMTATASISQRLLPWQKFGQFGSAAAVVTSLGSIAVGPAVGRFLDYTNHAYRSTYLIGSGLEVMAFLCGLVLYQKFKALGGPSKYVAPE